MIPGKSQSQPETRQHRLKLLISNQISNLYLHSWDSLEKDGSVFPNCMLADISKSKSYSFVLDFRSDVYDHKT